MKPYYSDEAAGIVLYHGDCREVLPTLAENSVDTVITDPPYHLTTDKRGGTGPASLNVNSPAGRARISTGFMGKGWDGGDVAFRPETWAAVLRVAKPGAFLLAFGGTRTYHRLACAIEDAGWEIRDCMMWLYGQGFPKSLDISKAIDKAAGAEREVVAKGKPVKRMIPGADQHRTGSWIKDNGREFIPSSTSPATDLARQWNGWGTALKPAWEPIIVAMKPLDGTFAENAETWGVAGLNIDGGRVGTDDGDRCRPPAKPTSVAYAHDAWTMDPANRKPFDPSGKGRWPANVILDEVAAAMLDDQTGMLGSGSGVVRKAGPGAQPFRTDRGWNQHSMKREGASAPEDYGDSGGASRFFYTAKASRSDRGHGNDHPTVKPTDLLKYLCKLTATPTGGVVLDPFAGSGTTLVAAREMGRRCIGIELKESHCAIIPKRLAQGVLFSAGRESALINGPSYAAAGERGNT